MKITAPINRVNETDVLIKAGADELYCGVYHSKWYGVGGRPNVKPSSRSSLKSFTELREIVSKAKVYNVPVFITLNSIYLSMQTFKLIQDDLRRAIDCEVGGFVVTSIALLKEIRRICKNTPVILSTMANCFNTETISYYNDLGVSRWFYPAIYLFRN